MRMVIVSVLTVSPEQPPFLLLPPRLEQQSLQLLDPRCLLVKRRRLTIHGLLEFLPFTQISLLALALALLALRVELVAHALGAVRLDVAMGTVPEGLVVPTGFTLGVQGVFTFGILSGAPTRLPGGLRERKVRKSDPPPPWPNSSHGDQALPFSCSARSRTRLTVGRSTPILIASSCSARTWPQPCSRSSRYICWRAVTAVYLPLGRLAKRGRAAVLGGGELGLGGEVGIRGGVGFGRVFGIVAPYSVTRLGP
jgi:hypothetical protein